MRIMERHVWHCLFSPVQILNSVKIAAKSCHVARHTISKLKMYSNEIDVWRLLSFFVAKIRECLEICIAQDHDRNPGTTLRCLCGFLVWLFISGGSFCLVKNEQLSTYDFVGFRNMERAESCFFAVFLSQILGANVVCLFDHAVLNQYSFVSGLAARFKSLLLLCRKQNHRGVWLFGILQTPIVPYLVSISQIVRTHARCLFGTPKSSITYLFCWFCGLLQWLAQSYQNNTQRLVWRF